MIQNTHTYRVHCDSNTDAVRGSGDSGLINPEGGHVGPIDVTVPDRGGEAHLIAELERQGWNVRTIGYIAIDERMRVYCPRCIDQGLV